VKSSVQPIKTQAERLENHQKIIPFAKGFPLLLLARNFTQTNCFPRPIENPVDNHPTHISNYPHSLMTTIS
jgi:hypothetical protein